MPEDNDRIVDGTQESVVFISPTHITRWMCDSTVAKAAFLNDCRGEGWPIFMHPNGDAYVFALREVAQ